MDPAGRVARSREAKFLLRRKGHLPQDVLEASQCVPDNESNFLELSWGNQIERIEEKLGRKGPRVSEIRGIGRQGTTEKCGNAFPEESLKVQGKLNLPSLAHMMNEIGRRRQEWVRRFNNGSPTVGPPAAPRCYLARNCADLELTPQQSSTNSKWRIKS